MGGWREGIEITEQMIKAGSAWEDKLNNFFIKAKDLSRDVMQENHEKTNSSLVDALENAKTMTFEALCDSFDTPAVMLTISELISTYNTTDKTQATPSTTLNIARWVTKMTRIFGLDGTARPEDETIGWSGLDIPEDAKPVLTELSEMRDTLRREARAPNGLTKESLKAVLDAHQATAEARSTSSLPFVDVLQRFRQDLSKLDNSATLSSDILQLSDRLRDVELWDRGIYLEDPSTRDGGQRALVRVVTKQMRDDKETQKRLKEESERQKQQAKADREQEAAAKAEKGRLSHVDMFKTDEYSAWDDDGMPTKDKAGEEITKSRTKKLKKDWERQKKLHSTWVISNGQG